MDAAGEDAADEGADLGEGGCEGVPATFLDFYQLRLMSGVVLTYVLVLDRKGTERQVQDRVNETRIKRHQSTDRIKK